MLDKLRSIIATFLIAFHKPYDVSNEENRALERERRIALTSLIAAVEKVITTAIPLITVRLTFNYLGIELYGLWNAVVNFFALFAFSDLGLGYGLQTKLSQATGKNDTERCKQLISSTYFILCVVASLLFIVFIIFFPIVDWAKIMNATTPQTIRLAAPIVFIIVLPKLLSIPVAIISRTQLALQEGYNYSAWSTMGSILSLIYIYCAVSFDLGIIALLTGTVLIPLLCSILNMFVYYGWQRKELRFSIRYINRDLSLELLGIGVNFCLLSILTTTGIAMDTFIVAKVCTLEEAGTFAVLSKVMYIVSATLTVLAQPLWGANGEALARGDVNWVRKNTKKMSMTMVSITLLISIIVVLLSKTIFSIWLGTEFQFPMLCLICLCTFQLCTAFISPYFMVLNASGIVRKQIVAFAIFTPSCFLLKFGLGRIYGISAIPAVSTILYFLIIVLYIYHISNNQLDRIECGNGSNKI